MPDQAVSLVDDYDDFTYADAWRAMSDEQRSALGPRGLERFRRITSYVSDSASKLEQRARSQLRDVTPPPGWPQPLNLLDLALREPEQPREIMEGLPSGYATGTFGHGGAGKSQIELMRAVCIALGIPFCNLETEQRKVTFVSCEDRADIHHWRLTRICRHLGIRLSSLSGWLNIIDLVGHDSLLFSPDPRSGNSFTAAYGLLSEHMRVHETELLVLDGISDTYGGNENARGEVKRFINSLLALIPPDRGAVLLIGHVNKMTAGNGATSEGYSGSTAWHNSCRARWYLRPEIEQTDDGPGQRTGKLIFELQKANHGEVGTQIEFEWDADAHLFVGTKVSKSRFDQQHQQREEQRGILRAFAACSATSIVVPAALTGPRTTYHTLSIQAEFPESLKGGAKAKTRRFWRHIEELRQMRAIEESSYRRNNRHTASQLAITSEGMRQCA